MDAISANHLIKEYTKGVRAVDDISFSVLEGEIFGMLGPNGAGKTTTIKMITTMTKPTSGTISVFGTSALQKPTEVRQMLGYVPQAVSADGDLTAYENLLIFAKLFYVERSVREKRIRDALEYMGLTERANDLVKHYSGGMMRRLEIAQALVDRPKILFLDEPSIGLDPSSRRQGWEYIKSLNKEFGTTIFITTHDMIEADELCDRVAIMNAGKIAVSGPPTELKSSIGGDVVTVRLNAIPTNMLIPREIGSLIDSEGETLRILTARAETAMPKIVDFFEKSGLVAESISFSRPNLDDVFVKYTKAKLQQETGTLKDTMATRRSFAGHAS